MVNNPFPTSGGEPVTENSETVLVEPVPAQTFQEQTNYTKIRYSYYTPWMGGTNCSKFVGGECVSRMASGERWQDYIDKAIACPPQIPFWTIIEAFGSEWICLDRGGAIQYVEGIPWLDFLTATPHLPFGSIIEVSMK